MNHFVPPSVPTFLKIPLQLRNIGTRVVPDVIFATGSDPAGYPDFFTGSGYPVILPDNRIVI